MPENTASSVEETVEKEEPSTLINGPLLLMLTVLLILILGAMYFWFGTLATTAPTPATQTTERPTVDENNEPESTTAEAQAETMLTTSTSDEISAIEADIEATDLEGLNAEMLAIEAEMDAPPQSN